MASNFRARKWETWKGCTGEVPEFLRGNKFVATEGLELVDQLLIISPIYLVLPMVLLISVVNGGIGILLTNSFLTSVSFMNQKQRQYWVERNTRNHKLYEIAAFLIC